MATVHAEGAQISLQVFSCKSEQTKSNFFFSSDVGYLYVFPDLIYIFGHRVLALEPLLDWSICNSGFVFWQATSLCMSIFPVIIIQCQYLEGC